MTDNTSPPPSPPLNPIPFAPSQYPLSRTTPSNWPMWNIDFLMNALEADLAEYIYGNDADKSKAYQPWEDLKAPYELGITGPEGDIPPDPAERELCYKRWYIYHELKWTMEMLLRKTGIRGSEGWVLDNIDGEVKMELMEVGGGLVRWYGYLKELFENMEDRGVGEGGEVEGKGDDGGEVGDAVLTAADDR